MVWQLRLLKGRGLKSGLKDNLLKVDPKFKDPLGKTKIEIQKTKAKAAKHGIKSDINVAKEEIDMYQKASEMDKKQKKAKIAETVAAGTMGGATALAVKKTAEDRKKKTESEEDDE